MSGSTIFLDEDVGFDTMAECNRHICDCWSASPSLAKCGAIRNLDGYTDNPACALLTMDGHTCRAGGPGAGPPTEGTCEVDCQLSVFGGGDFRLTRRTATGGTQQSRPFCSLADCNRHICDCWSGNPSLARCGEIKQWAGYKDDASCAEQTKDGRHVCQAAVGASNGDSNGGGGGSDAACGTGCVVAIVGTLVAVAVAIGVGVLVYKQRAGTGAGTDNVRAVGRPGTRKKGSTQKTRAGRHGMNNNVYEGARAAKRGGGARVENVVFELHAGSTTGGGAGRAAVSSADQPAYAFIEGDVEESYLTQASLGDGDDSVDDDTPGPLNDSYSKAMLKAAGMKNTTSSATAANHYDPENSGSTAAANQYDVLDLGLLRNARGAAKLQPATPAGGGSGVYDQGHPDADKYMGATPASFGDGFYDQGHPDADKCVRPTDRQHRPCCAMRLITLMTRWASRVRMLGRR